MDQNSSTHGAQSWKIELLPSDAPPQTLGVCLKLTMLTGPSLLHCLSAKQPFKAMCGPQWVNPFYFSFRKSFFKKQNKQNHIRLITKSKRRRF
jgi:hypothetical protein